MRKLLSPVSPELEEVSGKKYDVVFEEMWDYYEKNLLERFPYVGGDKVSGTKNLTGAYCFVAMGEVLKIYGLAMDDIAHLMVLSYERFYKKMPGVIRGIMGKIYNNPKKLNQMLIKQVGPMCFRQLQYIERLNIMPQAKRLKSCVHMVRKPVSN